jgi:hypothetical protein
MLIFIPRILLRRLENEEDVEIKCNFEEILWKKKDKSLKNTLWTSYSCH